MAKKDGTTVEATGTVILDTTLAPGDGTKNFAVFGTDGAALPQHAGKCVLLTNSKGQVYLGAGFNNLDPKKPVRIVITQ